MDYTIAMLEAEMPSLQFSALVTKILASSLRSVGLFIDGRHRIADLALEKQPPQYYERWLESTIQYLKEQDVLDADSTLRREVRPLGDLWAEWEGMVSTWGDDANRQAHGSLLRACLEALPDVLSGNRRATDIHRGNPQAGYFDDVLCKALSACIDEQLQADPERKIRIIEIGGDTGGTTAAVMPVLQRYPVEEYCYTHRSEALLMQAREQFQSRWPAFTTAVFDVSKPLDSQSVAGNHYDFAVAANALHATADIREALRNAKATLKNRGVLLLSEISTWSLYDHLTVGLLEEWWVYEDAAVRLPGSPALSPERWREILTAEGFESVAFPAQEAHELGQQIVCAVSNGWTRQRIIRSVPPPRTEAPDANAEQAAAPRAARAVSPSTPLLEQQAADHTRRIITTTLSETLRMDADKIQGDVSFADFGVDSIIGINLVRTISEALHIELETTSLFEYSTLDDLTRYILTKWHDSIVALVAPLQGAPETSASASTETRAEVEVTAEPRAIGRTRFAEVPKTFHSDRGGEPESAGFDPIAIIGMSGRFAESDSLDAFWQHLAEGRDLVKEVSRWRPEECVRSESAAYCSRGSFIDAIDQFDAAFFGIPALEATYMDPQQRLFLEESWKALEDAGYAGQGVQERQCGVYAGCGGSGYDRLYTGEAPAQAFWGNSLSVTPARIAYCLNLQGPAVAVDTACSSSLVAIHLACQSLWSRETEMALAGGVFVQANPGFYQVCNRAGMLSPDGKCYSFDARANGFTPGEGVGVLVLKRLRDAIADGDHIHGVIAGSGVNQNGKSNGLVAPNGRAQERLERSVYDRFKINPATIQVVEAHGAGTLFGDAIEHAALSRAFREFTDKKQFCALGTIKPNIGHASAAAGVASVLKILLSLRHRLIPPSIHFEKGNPTIDFASGPFYVNTELKPWSADGGIRRAAVSSFGFSGTNGHLIIDEAPAIGRREDAAAAYMVVLSARTGEQLKQQVLNLLEHLERTPDVAMADLSFTLFAGRMHFAHRLACIARSREELAQLLEQWVKTGAAAGRVYASDVRDGRVREHAALARLGNRCIQECRNATSAEYLENLAAIADLYVQGYSLDYQALFPEGSRRVPLPTYPFAREHYWVDAESAVLPRPSAQAARPDEPATEPAERTWLFSKAAGNGGPVDSMAAAEKMALFLRQEAALQLQKTIEDVPTDRSFFDLGLTSLAMTHVVRNTCTLLDENLSPSVLFDYGDIDSLAEYLATTYRARIDGVAAVRQLAVRPAPDVRLQVRAPQPTVPDMSIERVLESVSWQEESLHDGYEKVTF